MRFIYSKAGEGVVDKVRFDHPANWAAPSQKEHTGNRERFIILIPRE